jgi:hypothetical protein
MGVACCHKKVLDLSSRMRRHTDWHTGTEFWVEMCHILRRTELRLWKWRQPHPSRFHRSSHLHICLTKEDKKINSKIKVKNQKEHAKMLRTERSGNFKVRISHITNPN